MRASGKAPVSGLVCVDRMRRGGLPPDMAGVIFGDTMRVVMDKWVMKDMQPSMNTNVIERKVLFFELRIHNFF